jgi:hypothetical protein
MALTWDATKVEGFDSLTHDESVTRDSLVFMTMAVGMNSITEDNARTFFSRLSIWEKVNGCGRYKFDEDTQSHSDWFFSFDEVKRFVGLRTNATPKTQAAFNKGLWESHDRFLKTS